MLLSNFPQKPVDSDNLVHIILNKFLTQQDKRFPAHLNNVTTLPCETQKLCFCENSNAGKAKLKKFYLLTLILLIE